MHFCHPSLFSRTIPFHVMCLLSRCCNFSPSCCDKACLSHRANSIQLQQSEKQSLLWDYSCSLLLSQIQRREERRPITQTILSQENHQNSSGTYSKLLRSCLQDIICTLILISPYVLQFINQFPALACNPFYKSLSVTIV